jgi:tetratricopeptide (TPR) repeat protein
MDVWAFVKDFAKGAGRVATAWRRWGQEDRAEIEHTYKNELACLQEELEEADTGEEKTRIKREMKAVRQEQRLFYRARRDLLLSKALVERMTPKGTIIAGAPELPASERETLRIAMTLLQQLEPAISFADHFLRGNAFYAAQDFQSALQEYNEALALRPDDPDTLHNRGNTLDHLERYKEALADFSRALELAPDEVDILNSRGITLGRVQRYEEALADFNRARRLRPDHLQTLNNRGLTLAKLGRLEEALTDLDRALEFEPDTAYVLSTHALALSKLGQHERALGEFDRALSANSTDPHILNDRACAFSVSSHWQESLRDLATAIAGEPRYRAFACKDPDFAGLRAHPEFGPRFEKLIQEKNP